MLEVIALKVNDLDNVATIFSNDAKAGCQVLIKDKKGNSHPVRNISDVPYGHKIAVKTIASGEAIIKYGEEIGVATTSISAGDYVHVHNLDSQRARGDLAEKEGI